MTKINIEIDEATLKALVVDYFSKILNKELTASDIHIYVKSKQNYKSEWEDAAFKATVIKCDND